jgi:hypothetical protein
MTLSSNSLDILVCFANHQAKADGKTAEKFYRQALFLAEVSFGKDSPQAGMVLLSLLDLYDSQDMRQESKDAQARIRSILVKNAHLCDGQRDNP